MSRGQTNPILAAFFANTETPRQAAIDFLVKRHAVPALALGRDGDGDGFVLGEAYVEMDERGRFEFSDPPHDDQALRCFIVVARDEDGVPSDLVAWAPRADRVARYEGRCAMLGAHEVYDVGLDEVLPIHRTLLGWLKAGRCGAFIIDYATAWRLLDGTALGASDIDHGLELRRELQPPAPRVVVPHSPREAA